MGVTTKREGGGRPPKFNEARRPITVTLPERTLNQLAAISPDRAKAIVKLADTSVGNAATRQKAVDVVEIAPGKAIILVGPSASLQSIAWLRMVEVAPMRYLLVVPPGTAVESLEIAIMDLIEGLPLSEACERPVLEELRHVISHHRRRDGVSKAELLFVNI